MALGLSTEKKECTSVAKERVGPGQKYWIELRSSTVLRHCEIHCLAFKELDLSYICFYIRRIRRIMQGEHSFFGDLSSHSPPPDGFVPLPRRPAAVSPTFLPDNSFYSDVSCSASMDTDGANDERAHQPGRANELASTASAESVFIGHRIYLDALRAATRARTDAAARAAQAPLFKLRWRDDGSTNNNTTAFDDQTETDAAARYPLPASPSPPRLSNDRGHVPKTAAEACAAAQEALEARARAVREGRGTGLPRVATMLPPPRCRTQRSDIEIGPGARSSSDRKGGRVAGAQGQRKGGRAKAGFADSSEKVGHDGEWGQYNPARYALPAQPRPVPVATHAVAATGSAPTPTPLPHPAVSEAAAPVLVPMRDRDRAAALASLAPRLRAAKRRASTRGRTKGDTGGASEEVRRLEALVAALSQAVVFVQV